MVNLILRKDLP